jgi:formyltetrahydrofolate-dependent phosphoribosylglycinamide formyltransferase
VKPRTIDLAILISGSGRTLQNFIQEILNKRLDARIKGVVSSSARAGGNEYARSVGIPLAVVEAKAPGFSGEITKAVDAYQPDLVLLAGFLHLWKFPAKYEGRVLNIHPALLPDFGGKGMYGRHVHEAVLKSGAKESGCTVHIADLRYDRGPIILQRRVPVLPNDTHATLAARVFAEELIAYPEAVRIVAARLAEGGPPGDTPAPGSGNG